MPAVYYLPYIKFLPSVIFRFSNEEDGKILRLRLVMKNNVRYEAAHTNTERLMKLQRSCQQMVTSVFLLFAVSQLGGISIDQMKFTCWAKGIRTMSLKRCYNISDVETALQQPYYSQLWQADSHFLLSSYAGFNWLLLS